MIPRILGSNIIFQPKNLAQAKQVRACVPDVRFKESPVGVLGAAPLTLEAARILRNLGIDAPSPIEAVYNWPILSGRKPRPHQIKTSAHFTLNPRCHCHNSMRTGKTLSSLWAIDYCQKIGVVQRALIVAPLSTLERAWGDEIFLNFPGKKFAVLYGSAEKRRKILATKQDIYVINPEGVEILLPELMKRGDIDLVVIDELAQAARNSQTKRWKALNQLVNNRGIYTWCWGLTGTPVPNEPTDAYGQAKLIRPESVKGTSFTAFKNSVMQQFGPFKWCARKGSEDMVAKVLSPTIRYDRSVVTDMEPCLIERHAELSAEQKHHVNQLLREAVTEIQGETVSAVNAAVLISKVVQCCCGVTYGPDGKFLRLDFGPRLKVLEDAIEENSTGKVIVFLPFTGALNAVAAELKKRWTVEVVDGSVAAGKRNQIFKDFETRKDPHVLVAHPQCMAHGLSLVAADLIVWYAPITSNEIYMQACCRIDGGAQKSKIDILHLSSTATERRIYATVRERGRLQDCALDLLKKGRIE